jgi:hypothetical protein
MPYNRVSNNPWINNEAMFVTRISDKELQSIMLSHQFFGPQTNKLHENFVRNSSPRKKHRNGSLLKKWGEKM